MPLRPLFVAINRTAREVYLGRAGNKHAPAHWRRSDHVDVSIVDEVPKSSLPGFLKALAASYGGWGYKTIVARGLARARARR